MLPPRPRPPGNGNGIGKRGGGLLTGGVPRYAYTYADDPTINSDPVWNENFTLGDLPVDDYEVIVSERSGRVRFRETVTIESGRTTWIDIRLRP